MGFMTGKIMESTDAGKLRGIKRDVACECWFTSMGTTLPRFIKVMGKAGEIFTVQVLSVISADIKRYSGIETIEHVCKIRLYNREEVVKLVFNKTTCRWKIVQV